MVQEKRIQQYYAKLQSSLDGISPVPVHSHMFGSLHSIEQELISGKIYLPGEPNDYLFDFQEEVLGGRRLHNPADATYNGAKLRIGTTTLHIRDSQDGKNIGALIIVDKGGIRESLDLDVRNMLKMQKLPTIVAILDNGVIAASYFTASPNREHVSSWYPNGKDKYGEFPYPTIPQDVSDAVKRKLKISTLEEGDIKDFKILEELVMLAVNTHLQFETTPKGK